jgi:hypothetical protein
VGAGIKDLAMPLVGRWVGLLALSTLRTRCCETKRGAGAKKMIQDRREAVGQKGAGINEDDVRRGARQRGAGTNTDDICKMVIDQCTCECCLCFLMEQRSDVNKDARTSNNMNHLKQRSSYKQTAEAACVRTLIT